MTATLSLTPLVAAPAAAFAAAALLVFALRGRRVDDHPLCRKCGFDLFGKPPDVPAPGDRWVDVDASWTLAPPAIWSDCSAGRDR
jgi:hypothetical protein